MQPVTSAVYRVPASPGRAQADGDDLLPNGASANKVGDPVKVEVSSPYRLRAIMKIGTIQLSARTTMRIEQNAGRYVAGSFTPTTCP